ncbi:HamA C-terminal domain-containing protein [Cupriavidus basilensis]
MQDEPFPSDSRAGRISGIVDSHAVDVRIRRVEFTSTTLPCVNAHFLHTQSSKAANRRWKRWRRCWLRKLRSLCATRADRRKAKRLDNEAGDSGDGRGRRACSEGAEFVHGARRGCPVWEAGELLLYALIEHYLRAPLIVSKMRLKTSTNMPVHGADGLHAGWCEKTDALILYFGESKMHQTFASAMQDAAESVAALVTNKDGRLERELDLRSNFYDLGNFPEKGIEYLLRFLNPFETEEGNRRIDRFAIPCRFRRCTLTLRLLTCLWRKSKRRSFATTMRR